MSEPRRRIVYVPGIKPKPPPGEHRAVVWRCVLEGVRRADPAAAAELAGADCLSLVSWGHLFYEAYRDLSQDLPAIERLLRTEGADRTTIRQVLAVRHRLRYAAHRLGDRLPGLIGLLAGADTLANLAESQRYFGDADGKARRIRGLLAAVLEQAWADGERVLLMAHSLGSVIAWDTLWELGRRGRTGGIDLFLTLGSPLGNRFVRGRLLGADAPGRERFPRNIRRWRNLAAIGGLTALGRHMAVEYREMLDLGLVESITDDTGLINPYLGREGLNVHRCYGYFVNVATGDAIAGWWREAAVGQAARALQAPA